MAGGDRVEEGAGVGVEAAGGSVEQGLNEGAIQARPASVLHGVQARLNAAAVYMRLRSAEEWLRWVAEQMRGDLGMAAPRVGRRVRAVEATAVLEPGSTGTDWRIHYAFNLQTLQCDFSN